MRSLFWLPDVSHSSHKQTQAHYLKHKNAHGHCSCIPVGQPLNTIPGCILYNLQGLRRQPLHCSVPDQSIILRWPFPEQLVLELDIFVCSCSNFSGCWYKSEPNEVLSSTKRHPLPRGASHFSPGTVSSTTDFLKSLLHAKSLLCRSCSRKSQVFLVWIGVVNHTHHKGSFENHTSYT